MCKLKSGIVLKDKIYIPDHDHHTQMLEELGIEDNRHNAETLFVRVELSPCDGDVFSPVDTWELNVDQDIRPDWFFEEVETPKIISAVKTWTLKHIYIGVDNLNLSSGAGYYLKNCQNATLTGSVTVSALHNSTVREMWGSSTVREMWGSSTVGTMRENSTVRAMLESSTVGKRWGSSTVREMWGSSTVGTMRENSTVRAMLESSTVGKMWESSTVREMRGSSTVGEMWESSTVGTMWGNSTVREMWENSTVRAMLESSTVGKMRRNSTAAINEYWADGVKPETVILRDNATIKDNRTKTIYHSGDWKLAPADAK